MIKKLIPLVFAILGTGCGVVIGLLAMPSKEVDAQSLEAENCLKVESGFEENKKSSERGGETENREYVKLNNQFVVPIMGEKRVESLVVASLSIEISGGSTEEVYAKEPKLRDAFLQVMFNHANIGGFDGAFTSGQRMDVLRSALFDVAKKILENDVSDVLITEIARQDI